MPAAEPGTAGYRLTARAESRVRSYLADREEPHDLRIAADPEAGFEFRLVPRDDRRSDDRVRRRDGFRVLTDPATRRELDGAVVDFVSLDEGEGFCVLAALEDRIEQVLEEEVNPTVSAHGGQVELVEVSHGIAGVRMSGGCQGCRAARLTLKGVVERMLRSRIPEIEGVEDLTDHDRATEPFLPAGPVARPAAAADA